MASTPQPPSPRGELDFNSVEPAQAAGAADGGQACVVCHQPVGEMYFALADQLLCPACAETMTAPPGGSRYSRLLTAGCFGLAAGLLGALIWFVIRRTAHMELGLVALLVGWMVGKAVRKGSRNVGGLGYQVLAVVLTYSCIAANYMPDIVEAVIAQYRESREEDKKEEAPQDPNPEQPISGGETAKAFAVFFVLVFGLALAAPFLAGAQNLMGLLIIGFALWEAWKFNARQPLPITGPYRMGSQPA